MQTSKTSNLSLEDIEIKPENLEENVNWAEIFGNDNPLHIEIGSGKGKFLLEMATLHPDKNFIGIEIRYKRMKKIGIKAAREGFNNVKVIAENGKYFLPRLFTPESVEAFYILFPDPWPKRRHAKRRLFDQDFVNIAYKLLQKEGHMHVATDVKDYSKIMLETLENQSGLKNLSKNGIEKESRLPIKTIHHWKFELWGRELFFLDFIKQ